MANSIGVRIATGDIERAIRNIGLLRFGLRQRVKDLVKLRLLLIETDAKLFAPVDTGRLRSAIHSEVDANGLGGSVEVDVDYAVYQEFGTTRIPAHPFLAPAFEKNRLPFIADLRAAGLKF